MALISAGSGLAGAGILAGSNILGSALNGANSESYGTSTNDSSYGYSGSSSSYSDNYSESWDNIYGSEASAKDIQRAKEANELQDKYLLAQMEYNAKEAQVAREWQEYMSNTSYQRAVADLYKAGLNPILAAGNYGASTPMGAMASSGLQTAHKAQTFADRRAGSYSESHSESSSSESGGGSSHGESEQSSKAEQQATSLAKGAAKTVGEAVKSLAEGINKAFNNAGSAKSFVDGHNVPLNY